ncbi:MAG TPA: antitoxin Xre/MbcA/ParS toxin-binding domain-containing protein [Tepidisphaeraceae bacterium]|jgi:putative toxin-antitoxin system antitoxin component (TIGR02293 family)|nr:antitoxin Xre/MbcA/ParS toxin-binding domain-containing protein [Tepidisphaeraceae bacterium]
MRTAKWQNYFDNLANNSYDKQMPNNLFTMNVKLGKWTRLGSSRGNILGLSAKSTSEMVQRLEAGFHFNALIRFHKVSGLPMATISDFVQIPPRTLARRKTARRLRPEESERLLRIAELFEKALRLFEGDVAAARSWLTRPNKALGHEPPIAYARTEVGAREVEDLVDRLEHGVFS